VSCGTSRVVSGAHRVVSPGTHRGSGRREVHTTEQETTVRDPRREADEARKALEVEKKQVDGELVSVCFFACRFAFWGFAPNFPFLCPWLSGLRTALGNTTTQAEATQAAYNSSQQELEEL
jgi:hypothetical protein